MGIGYKSNANLADATGVTATGYFFARKDDAQTLGVANTDELITFSSAGATVGWVFNGVADDFTCTQAGTYLFQIITQVQKTGGTDSFMEVLLNLDGTNDPSTTMGVMVTTDNQVHQFSNMFILAVGLNQIVTLRFNANTTDSQIVIPTGNDTFTSLQFSAVRIA